MIIVMAWIQNVFQKLSYWEAGPVWKGQVTTDTTWCPRSSLLSFLSHHHAVNGFPLPLAIGKALVLDPAFSVLPDYMALDSTLTFSCLYDSIKKHCLGIRLGVLPWYLNSRCSTMLREDWKIIHATVPLPRMSEWDFGGWPMLGGTR